MTLAQRFLGRQSELEVLRDAYGDVASGRGPRVALLRGEPGIGKTALMSHFMSWACAEGAQALDGGCTEVPLVPYQPFVEALRGGGHAVPSRPSTGTDTDRFLFFNSVAATLGEASATTTMVLGLDDLHWADPHSIELLDHLVASASLPRLMVIGTYRDTDVVDAAGVGARLGELATHEAAVVIDVPGWTENEIAQHAATVIGDEAPGASALASALLRETDGNPFFVEELVRHIVETNRLDLDPATLPVPDSVRDVVLARAANVGDLVYRVLSTAAVAGPRFDATLLATVGGIHPDAASDVLERAAQVALVRPATGEQYEFTHALVRHALYDDLSATRRSREHVQIGDVLERRFAEMAAEHAAQLAHHFVAGRDSRAVDYACRAGDAALAALAPQDAVRWYGNALQLSERSADRLRALVGLGDAERQAGSPEFRTTLLAAADLALELDDNASLTAAALANSRGFASMTGAADGERVRVLEAAVAAAPAGAAGRARLLSLLAVELGWGFDAARLRALSDEALAIARRGDDAAALRDVLAHRVMAIWSPSSLDERLANTAELERISRASGDVTGEFWACFYRTAVSLEAGDGKELRRCATRASELAEEIGQPLLRWTTQVTNSWVTLLGGDVERAEALANDALATGNALGQPDALSIYAALLFGIRWQQGRLGELVRLIEAGVKNFPDMPTYQATLAWTYVEGGRLDDARPLLRAAADAGFIAPELVWLVTSTLWAQVAATVRDSEAATTLYEMLLPWRDQTVFSGANAYGPVAYYLGRLAALVDRADDAAQHFRLAVARADDIGSPFFRALAINASETSQ